MLARFLFSNQYYHNQRANAHDVSHLCKLFFNFNFNQETSLFISNVYFPLNIDSNSYRQIQPLCKKNLCLIMMLDNIVRLFKTSFSDHFLIFTSRFLNPNIDCIFNAELLPLFLHSSRDFFCNFFYLFSCKSVTLIPFYFHQKASPRGTQNCHLQLVFALLPIVSLLFYR